MTWKSHHCLINNDIFQRVHFDWEEVATSGEEAMSNLKREILEL